jgi:uncharacterized membrane protein
VPSWMTPAMSELVMVLVAAGCAVAMLLLAQAGADPNLRSAVRTSLILAVAWGFAWTSHSRNLPATLQPRTQVLVALSVVVLALAWMLWFRARRRPTSGPAPMDRLNVVFAGAFAAVLFAGRNDSLAWITGFLMVLGAFILSRGRI